MKTYLHIITLILTALIALPLPAQTVRQKGVTYRYNGSKKRTPIGGVYIKASTSDNGEVSDDATGSFELVLKNLRMGSPIGNVRVTKQGMMVFNQQAVDEWSVRKEPLRLILCNADEFQKQKDNLIAIGRNEAKKKYDRRLAELEKQNEAKQLQIDDYYNKLDSLEKEYQNAIKHMDKYADVFARIDESEVDTVAQRAIEMFNRGDIEESIRLLENQDYMEKLLEANRTIAQADALISTAEEAKTLAEQDIQQYLEGINAQIAGYKLKNEWEKAKDLLKGLADNLNTFEDVWNYADFCYNQNDFKDAEAYYLKCLEFVNDSKDMEEFQKLVALSRIYTNLALIYGNTQHYGECEKLYKSALDILERLVQSNPSTYERDLAVVQMNLAILYYDTHSLQESERMYKSALEIYERLSQTDPIAYAPDMAMTQANLANLYVITQRYSEGETMNKSALEIYEQLSEHDPLAFRAYVANTRMNLASLYSITHRNAESEAMFKSALDILGQLAQSNPAAYESKLANAQMNLAVMYRDVQRYTESEAMYKSALEIWERLVQSNPDTYEPRLAMTQMNLANLYRDTQRYAESEEMYKSAVTIRERLVKSNPSVYEPVLAMTYTNFAVMYKNAKRYSECEDMYKSALKLYGGLAKSNPAAYEPDLAKTYGSLANLYSDTRRYLESEEMYKSALTIRARLAKSNPSMYEPYLAMTQMNLGVVYDNTQRYSEGETMYKSALELYERLAQSNPFVYDPYLAMTYWNFASLYHNTQRYSESEPMYKSALELYERLAKANPSAYEPNLVMTKINLVNLYAQIKQYSLAYNLNVDLLSLLKKLYGEDAGKWKNYYAGQNNSQSFYANLLGKFKEGEQYSLETLKVEPTLHVAYTNLAAALLFQGKVEEAEMLYRQYKSEFKKGFLADFAEFERVGVIPEERKADVERIKVMLNEE